MCTFENKQSVLVCDLAIHHVREAVGAAFGDAIQYTPIIGQGTRVEARSSLDAEPQDTCLLSGGMWITCGQLKPRHNVS